MWTARKVICLHAQCVVKPVLFDVIDTPLPKAVTYVKRLLLNLARLEIFF